MKRYNPLFEKFDKPIDVSVNLLLPYSAFSKFPWNSKVKETPISREEIKNAITNNEFQKYDSEGSKTGYHFKDRDWHVQRIAWLVKNGWREPIRVDVGFDEYPSDDFITDGNHRLSASIYRNDKKIKVLFHGSERRIKSFLENGYVREDI